MCLAACKFLETDGQVDADCNSVERIAELCGIFCDGVAARHAYPDRSAAKNGFAARLFLGFIKLQFQRVCDIIVKVF